MTVFKNNGMNWEWTLLVDTFNNEILAHQATPITGSNKPYYHCLEVLKKLAGKKNEEQTPQVVFHTDQGSVYSSQAFCQAHEHYNILRSMSKAGTPTDNAIIEALNGGSRKSYTSTLVWVLRRMFLSYWMSMWITSITGGLRPLWVIKAQFSTRPNWASKERQGNMLLDARSVPRVSPVTGKNHIYSSLVAASSK